ncbi:MAG: hypothetical protein AAFR64_07185 [Pseudomonadota bacterium]
MLGRLFRLPPIVYFVLAPIFAALGVALFISSNNEDAERAAALSHAAPDMVNLQDVTSGDTGNDFNEIVVVAQVDVDNIITLEKKRRRGGRSYEVFVPLYPTDATDLSAPVAAVMEIDGRVSDEKLAQFYITDGPAGPIFAINGVWDGSNNGDADDAFEGYKTIASTVTTVRPFLDGREAGLQAKEAGTPLLIGGLILALLMGIYGYFRKRSVDNAKAEEEAEYAEG